MRAHKKLIYTPNFSVADDADSSTSALEMDGDGGKKP